LGNTILGSSLYIDIYTAKGNNAGHSNRELTGRKLIKTSGTP